MTYVPLVDCFEFCPSNFWKPLICVFLRLLSVIGLPHTFILGSGQKQVYRVCSGPKKNRCIPNSSKKRTLRALPLPKAHCTCFGADKAQVHPSLSTLLGFQPFLSFFSQLKRPSGVPPYAPHTNANVRGDSLHPPHPTPRHTSNTRICLHTSAEIQRDDIRMPTCTMATDGSASAASEIEEGSIHPTMQQLRAAAAKRAKQADTCAAGVAWCGMWRVEGGGGRPVRRHSYRGHRVGLWRTADWKKKRPKAVESQVE